MIGARKIFLKAELDNLTPKARRTRAALIKAAKSLIGREGTAGVNVMTACAEANVGRTSFYNYFEDIDVLIAAVAFEAAADIKARFDESGIEIPFPHRTLLITSDKKDESRPLPDESSATTMHSRL